MIRARWHGLAPAGLAALLVACGAGVAAAGVPPACGREGAAPDPRCGDELDGRDAPGPPDPSAARALLAAPRLVARAAFWAPVRVSELLEVHQVFPRLEALLTSDDQLVGVRPEVQYATGFVPTAGLRLFYRRTPLPGGEAAARLRSGGPSTALAELSAATPPWLGVAWRGAWSRRPDYLFSGVGPATDAELAARGQGPARYGADSLFTELRWSRRFWEALRPTVHGDVGSRRYTTADTYGGPSVAEVYSGDRAACAQRGVPPGRCVDPLLLPGFERGLRIAHVGAALGLELGREGRDGSGFSVAVGGTYGQGVAGDPTRLGRVTAESLVALGGLDRLLLLRVCASMVDPARGTVVPFEELVSPSGLAGMRGFADGRFRDRSGIVGTVEYRWFVAFNLDASLFVDVGAVAGPRFAGLDSSRLLPTYGLGLRRYAKLPAHYWLAPPADGVQLAYAPDAGLRVLLSLAAF
jgi:hypothetical protein